MRTVVFVIPCVQTLIIGYAVSTDVRHVPTGRVRPGQHAASRELVARFVRSGYFDVAAIVKDDQQARTLLDHGDVGVVLHVKHGYADDLHAGHRPFQVLVDGSDSNTAAVVLGYVGQITDQYGQQIFSDRFVRARGVMRRPPGRSAYAFLVQPEPGAPQLLRAPGGGHRPRASSACC